jgi:hypothetical protein
MNSTNNEKCKFCGEYVPHYSIIYVPIDKVYHCSCLNCYNAKMAEYSGFDLADVNLDPIILKDSDDIDHKFHFTIKHLGEHVGLEAFEVRDGQRCGYEFSHIGNIEEEFIDLFAKLVERMMNGLYQKHLQWSDLTKTWQINKKRVVRAKISCDLLGDTEFGHPPLIVIDGKELSWEDFGRMLMTFEGFNFKLEIFERHDEIP